MCSIHRPTWQPARSSSHRHRGRLPAVQRGSQLGRSTLKEITQQAVHWGTKGKKDRAVKQNTLMLCPINILNLTSLQYVITQRQTLLKGKRINDTLERNVSAFKQIKYGDSLSSFSVVNLSNNAQLHKT